MEYPRVHRSHGSHPRRAGPPSPRDALALLGLGVVYWLRIYPQSRRELARWEHRARTIPDRVLREQALGKLTGERLNPEAAALFAVLAPRAQRRRVVTLIVAYQVLYDYLDALNEGADSTELKNGLQLHRALTEAVVPDLPMSDYYRHHPRHRDGGYMRALTEMCRCVVRTLPSLGCGAQVLARATERCAQAQSHNHAIVVWGESRLIAWSHTQASGRGDYLWWELAAGGISCLGIHALLASAADAATVERDSLGVDAAYFPPICALSALLDSLADYHSDADTANHRFVSHYRDGGHAAERLTAIAADAREGVKRLRHSRRHAIILAGISSYYLSSRSVEEGFPAAAAQSLIRSAGPLALPMRAVMRLRRRLHARRPRYSWRASLAGARAARRPGKTSTMSAAPTTAPTVSSICGIEVENGAGKPLTSRR
jgi:tetraprenyl-beta-curcumene synthase